MNYSDILKSFFFLNFFSKTPNNFFPVDISGSFKIEGRSIRLSSTANSWMTSQEVAFKLIALL